MTRTCLIRPRERANERPAKRIRQKRGLRRFLPPTLLATVPAIVELEFTVAEPNNVSAGPLGDVKSKAVAHIVKEPVPPVPVLF